MERRFSWNLEDDLLKVTDGTSGYELSLFLKKDRGFELYFRRTRSARSRIISGRPLKLYDQNVRDLKINPNLQYIEVGAGLGGFIPHMLSHHDMKHRPIVIDPADYNTMKMMLEFTKGINSAGGMKKTLQSRIDLCDLYLDESRIRRMQMTINEAVKKHPGIKEMADVVVDNAGMFHGDLFEPAICLERELLKPNGKLVLGYAR